MRNSSLTLKRIASQVLSPADHVISWRYPNSERTRAWLANLRALREIHCHNMKRFVRRLPPLWSCQVKSTDKATQAALRSSDSRGKLS